MRAVHFGVALVVVVVWGFGCGKTSHPAVTEEAPLSSATSPPPTAPPVMTDRPAPGPQAIRASATSPTDRDAAAGAPLEGACSAYPRCAVPAITPDMAITLERSACFGTCPAYTVTVRADGDVQWNGLSHVDVERAAHATVPPAAARAVLEQAFSSCVPAMRDDYPVMATDHAYVTTTLVTGTTTKTVRRADCRIDDATDAAQTCAAREALAALEKKIDEVAGTRRFIGSGSRKRRR